MPLYYFLDFDCEPRRTFGKDALLRLVQDRILMDNIRASFAASGTPHITEAEMAFSRVHTTPTGETSREPLSVAALRERTRPLSEHESACVRCPANMTTGTYGCIHTMSFPIPEESEDWLLRQVGTHSSLAGQVFRASVTRMNYGNCELLHQWRAAGFLENHRGLMRREEGDPHIVTSDQILHALFMSGDLSPVQALSVLLFLQALALNNGRGIDHVIALIDAIQHGNAPDQIPGFVLRLLPEETDPPPIFELKTFVIAAFRAFSLEVPLAIRTSL